MKREEDKPGIPEEPDKLPPESSPPGGSPGTGPAAPEPVSGRRKWAFRVAAMALVPAGFLLALEGGLRVFGFGHPTVFFVEHPSGGARVSNIRFGLRFFPQALVREPVALRVPGDKGPDAYRVFVLGESAAMGEPDPAFASGRILQVMLEERYPGVRFEVYNAAMTAINSHVVLEIARDCARLEPDLFVIYMGNNEVVGPYGAGTVFRGYSPSLGAIRLGIRARKTRTGQLLGALGGALSGERERIEAWKGMEMFLGHAVAADDPRLARIRGHFRRNLEDILEVARRSGASTVLCTMAVNVRDCAPFLSLHRGGLPAEDLEKWNAAYEEGVRLEKAGDAAGAIAAYLQAERFDGRFADLHYRIGRCLWARGEWGAAHGRFLRALELDALRFRADPAVNALLREAALRRGGEGFRLADAEAAFQRSERTPHGVPGGELFHEHVHMNFEGNWLLAATVFREVEGLLPGPIRAKRTGPAAPPDAETCARKLALTGLHRLRIAMRIQNIVSRPPFTNQMDFERRRADLEAAIRELENKYKKPAGVLEALLACREAVARDPEDLQWQASLGLLEQETKKWDEAAGRFERMLEVVPGYRLWIDEAAKCRLEFANVLFREGKPSEAEAELRKALERKPGCGEALYNLGLVMASQKRWDEAIREYRRALKAIPASAEAHCALGFALAARGEPRKGLREYWLSTAFDPGNELARGYLADECEKNGDIPGSAAHLLQALDFDPSRAGIRSRLEALAWRLATDGDASRRDGEAALWIARRLRRGAGAAPFGAEIAEAAALAELGRFAEAASVAGRALDRAQREGDPAMAAVIRTHLLEYRAGRPVRAAGGR